MGEQFHLDREIPDFDAMRRSGKGRRQSQPMLPDVDANDGFRGSGIESVPEFAYGHWNHAPIVAREASFGLPRTGVRPIDTTYHP